MYDRTNKFLYVDGMLDAQVAVTGTLGTNSEPVWIGANNLNADRNFGGQMDDLRLWNIARSAEEIQANRRLTCPSPGFTNGLVAWFPFHEGRGTNTANFAAPDSPAPLQTGVTWTNSP